MRKKMKLLLRRGVAAATALGMVAAQCGIAGAKVVDENSFPTATPIKHLVVIFGENISFDHYFATYPNATNPAGEPAFTAGSRDAERQWLERSSAYHESELLKHREQRRRGESFPP